MATINRFSRRGFLEAIAAAGTLAVAACATTDGNRRRSEADRKAGKLPTRGEFVVRNA